MALPIPYTFIQCPCSDESAVDATNGSIAGDIAEDDERTFDPRAARSKYSLYPLEYLLYCEDCQQIRCPRCVNEEIVTYYCPNCLFEVPSSNLRSEGTRCNRSCYQCPVCIGPLSSVPLGTSHDANLLGADQNPSSGGPFALICQHCNWSSSEVGIEFDRPSGISSQLSKMKNGGQPRLTMREVKERRKEQPDADPVPEEDVDGDLQYSILKSFYSGQLSELNTSMGGMHVSEGMGFSSPAALSRIMSLYTGRGGNSARQTGPADVMREALHSEEGLKVTQLDDSAAIERLHSGGWDETTSREQRESQLEPVRFQHELRPIPYLLRTKRSKRCPVCRHIISKPEAKVSSTRFKIRLVAKSCIPTIAIQPRDSTKPRIPVYMRPNAAEEMPLRPFKPVQYVLTFKNPLFDKVRVTLAAPNNTPGRFSSKVTILCPQFEVSANTDMWDEALSQDGRLGGGGGGGGREEESGQGEAGKIFARGRNSVSILLEVVPSSLRLDTLGLPGEQVDRSPLKEDEDILEIPLFVRMEWEADPHNDMGTAAGRDRDVKEKRELAYWCVLGVGRISRD